MSKNIKVHLYKDSDCDLCKLMQQELTNNTLNADVYIHHIKHNKNLTTNLNIKEFPTTILMDGNDEIIRYEGFIDSESINIKIKEYEAKYMV